MNIINKIILRNFKKNKFVSISAMFLFTISIILVSSALFFFPKATNSVQELKNNANIHDGTLQATSNSYENINDDLIIKIEDKYNIYIEEHFEYDYIENEKKFRFKEYNSNSKLDIPQLYEGEYPVNTNEVMISKTSADDMNFNVNDIVSIGENNFKIVGIGYFAEYIHEVDLDAVITPNAEKFQVFYTLKKTIDKLNIDDKNCLYKYQIKKSNNDIDIDKILNDISNEYAYDNNIMTVTDNGTSIKMNNQKIFTQTISYDQDVAASTADEEIISGRNAMFSLSAFIIIISILMMIILIKSILKKNRREMGILIAEGVHKSELKKAYSLKVFKLLFLFMICGIVIGYYINLNLINVYKIMFNIPYEFTYYTDTVIAVIICIIIVIMCTLIIYYFAIRETLNHSALELIKNINVYKDKKIKKSRINKKIKFSARYKIYLMISNVRFVLLFVFAIIVSSTMLIFSSFMFSYITQLGNYDIEEQYGYKKQIIIEDLIPNIGENQGLSLYLSVKENNDYIEMNTFELSDDNLFNISTESSNEIDRDLYKDGVIISKLVANEYNYKVGDSVALVNPFEEDSHVTFKINGISNSLLGMKFVTSHTYASTILDNNLNYNSFYVNDSDAETILKEYKGAMVVEIEKFSESINNAMSIMWLILRTLCIISILIAFIVISVISYLVINSNSKTISIMKAIGYTNKEIKHITLSMFKWILIFMFFICYPIVKQLLNAVINKSLSEIGLFMKFELDIRYSFISLFVLLLIYLISSNISYIFLNKITLRESLHCDD